MCFPDSGSQELSPVKNWRKSELFPVFFSLPGIPVSSSYFTATFADDTALLVVGDNELQAARILQQALHNVSDWTKRWKVKLNHFKSVHVDFTYKLMDPIKLYIDNEIPHSNTFGYDLRREVTLEGTCKDKTGRLKY